MAEAIALTMNVTSSIRIALTVGALYAAGNDLPADWAPTEKEGIISDGTNPAVMTPIMQAILDDAAGSAPTNYVYGRGKAVLAQSGVTALGRVDMSTWTSLRGQSTQAGSVWRKTLHSSVEEGLIQFKNDAETQRSISAQALIEDMTLDGDKLNALTVPDSDPPVKVLEHGIYMPELTGEKDDAPVLNQTLVANFSGSGVKIGKRHNQLRFDHLKCIANDGWGLEAEKSADSKGTKVGMGRNLEGQIKLVNCASWQFTQFDAWTPGGGTFKGLYCIYLESCRNTRFVQGEIQGVVRVLGGNYDLADQTRFQITGNTFAFFNIKVSPETFSGVQYPGHLDEFGDPDPGPTAYDAFFQMRGECGTKFAHGIVGYSQGEATAEELAATPKYIWKFTTPSGGNPDHGGWIEISDIQFLHMAGVEGERLPQVAFTNKIASEPEKVVHRTLKPGQIITAPTAAPQVNWVRLLPTTQTLDTLKYPVLYVCMNNANQLNTAPATFDIPAAIAVETGMSRYIVAW